MPRYILIDDDSGYIFGDTADMPSGHVIDGVEIGSDTVTPILAAQWLDETVIGEHGRHYEEVPRDTRCDGGGLYHVFRADVGGSEAVPVIRDGQD